jgi:hypothetical protein
MGFCTNCGAARSETAQFCTTCGAAAPNSLLAPARNVQTIEVRAPNLWHVTYATGQRGGPFTDDAIRGMIARQELRVTDSIVAQGGPHGFQLPNHLLVHSSPRRRASIASRPVPVLNAAARWSSFFADQAHRRGGSYWAF